MFKVVDKRNTKGRCQPNSFFLPVTVCFIPAYIKPKTEHITIAVDHISEQCVTQTTCFASLLSAMTKYLLNKSKESQFYPEK